MMRPRTHAICPILAALLWVGTGWCGATEVQSGDHLSLRADTVAAPPAPTPTDRNFVGLGTTQCTFRSDGPLIVEIPVTRYLGPTNEDGYLVDAEELIQRGFLERYAKLIIPAFDVDFHSDPTGPLRAERDRVRFNGTSAHLFHRNNATFLRGANDLWRVNVFLIPIDKIKFPSGPRINGVAPVPVTNEVRIDIDVDNYINGVDHWCTAVNWAELQIKAMSPMILIHGNNSHGGFYEDQGFTDELDDEKLLYDNSISHDPKANFITVNSGKLNSLLPAIVKSFGVDSVHLVCHSKGGLDTRDYLVKHKPNPANRFFDVLSLTTLSTPHNGSALADLQVRRESYSQFSWVVNFSGLPVGADTLGRLVDTDDGSIDLQVSTCSVFNSRNLPDLPRSVVYNTIAADADQDGNGEIDIVPDEYTELLSENATLAGIHAWSPELSEWIVNRMYQTLRSVAGIARVSVGRIIVVPIGSIRTITIHAAPTATPLGNDTLVTVPSGLGTGTLDAVVTATGGSASTLSGAQGRNHASVADSGVASIVVSWVKQIEDDKGDFTDLPDRSSP